MLKYNRSANLSFILDISHFRRWLIYLNPIAVHGPTFIVGIERKKKKNLEERGGSSSVR